MDNCKVCIDMDVAYERYALKQPPISTKFGPIHGAALSNSLWEPGSQITIAIMEEYTPLTEEIRAVANSWTYYANLDFVWLDNHDSSAHIRIGLNPGGSWAYIGTQCLGVPRIDNTMNFGWLKEYYNRNHPALTSVVLHEFGHALGMIHEHQHPHNPIPWNKPKVYAYYAKQGWTKEQVDFNLFYRYDESLTQFSQPDLDSIMHYPIDNALTLNNFDVGWNTHLSIQDKTFISTLYPGRDNTVYLPFISKGS